MLRLFDKLFNQLRLIRHVDFMRLRIFYISFAILIMLASILLMAIKGLNFGIDFRGGLTLEMKIANGVTIADLRQSAETLPLQSYSLQEFGGKDVLLMRLDKSDELSVESLLQLVKANFGDKVVEYRRVETVGPVVGAELKKSALWTMLAGLGMIFLYIWLRFEWQFALGGVVAILHDVLATMGVFTLLGLEFNLVSVAAVLTIAGYSINDTVVIFDRVRENIRRYQQMPLLDIFNLSLNETMSRTILTSTLTMISMIALALFGGSAIKDFGLVMVFGIVFGVYSSIALALPTVLYFRPNKKSNVKDGGYGELLQKSKDRSK